MTTLRTFIVQVVNCVHFPPNPDFLSWFFYSVSVSVFGELPPPPIWSLKYSEILHTLNPLIQFPLTSIVMAHSDVMANHVGQRSGEQMRLVYVEVHANSHCLLRAHCLGGSHASLAARKDLPAVKEQREKERERDENLWLVNSAAADYTLNTRIRINNSICISSLFCVCASNLRRL